MTATPDINVQDISVDKHGAVVIDAPSRPAVASLTKKDVASPDLLNNIYCVNTGCGGDVKNIICG
jgi:hypothetical protein